MSVFHLPTVAFQSDGAGRWQLKSSFQDFTVAGAVDFAIFHYNVKGVAFAFLAQRSSGLGRFFRRGAKCASTMRGSMKRGGWGLGASLITGRLSSGSLSGQECSDSLGFDSVDGFLSSML